MNLILLGPPGAGKGTQALVLSRKFNLAHISTGDILREEVKASTPIGKKAEGYMKKGLLVPDQVVTQMVVSRIKRSDAENGFMLDGFPRTEEQAKSLDAALKAEGRLIDRVLYFKTSPEVCIERLVGRRVCDRCGANYHIKNRPPKKEGICDNCGARLIQRQDDTLEIVKNRLKVYEEKTKSLILNYKNKGNLATVSGDLDVEELFKKLEAYFRKEGLI